MKKHHKHQHLARRKMGHIIDEIYTSFFHFGSKDVNLHINREESGLRLFVKADFLPEHLTHVKRMGELLQPAIRSAAMVEEFWELAGEDGYSNESEIALVGHMADDASMVINGSTVEIELFVAF